MNAPRPSKPIVSIIVPSYNRLGRLERCLGKIRENVNLAHETIVVSGGTSDGTEAWLAEQPEIRFIREARREGAARAVDKGFRVAAGIYVMWLNDDSFPLPGAVEAAVRTIERTDLEDVGMVAFYHNFDRQRNRLDSVMHEGVTYSIYNVRGTPYANFGLLRRRLLEQLGYLDLRYYFAAWDPDLSLKVQREAGLKVVGCREALVFHEELMDERKTADLEILEEDNRKLMEKWDLPEKQAYPDPAPAYQTMLRERALV